MANSELRLDGGETAELLSFLGDWLFSDEKVLSAWLGRFLDTWGQDCVTLHADLARFAFFAYRPGR